MFNLFIPFSEVIYENSVLQKSLFKHLNLKEINQAVEQLQGGLRLREEIARQV